ncbi:hypothetical protein [Pseudomonas amygdali]|uniref:hypothetical protein n=1 Tax=Pseudomonas amygdali TaxID=47877 RepID=UPI000EFF9C99|nr:hypothetical protein [Pseudomonas amygdali]
MAGQAPKPMSSEIADRINALAAERSRTGSVNDWSWRLVKKDIESLRRIPEFAPQSLIFEAIIWSIAYKANETERCFNLYAGQYGKDWAWYRARAMQGPALGRTDMVVDMLEAGYPQASVRELKLVSTVCNQAGLFISSAEALDKCLKLDPSSLRSDEVNHLSHLKNTVPYMVENSVDEREVSKRIAVASRVVIDMSGPLTTFSIHTSEAGITFEYTVDADIERLVEIDLAISEALVDGFAETLSMHVSIGVTPADERPLSVS